MRNFEDCWRGALWGLFVGDALAMPVHGYYDVAALRRDFGVVRDFQALALT
jgi:ADP-ribosylglycohydrolase